MKEGIKERERKKIIKKGITQTTDLPCVSEIKGQKSNA